MAVSRAVSGRLACRNCQHWVLRSFIASVVGQAPPPPQSFPTSPQRRHFAVTRTRCDRGQNQATIQRTDLSDGLEDVTKETPEPPAHPQESAPRKAAVDSSLPWYLQVQQPLPSPPTPLADRQKIPDLPPDRNPPPLLHPLMQHVSVELGIDDLSLLDLRALDPPPALGSNLFMIIGTARSEKHLHVSADRLCRWLRTEYKLSPYADGLLGRNELKLKMRRKAKRTRLLSAVGAKETASAELDDGIRTGWVCVNVGRVPGGELSQNTEDSREGRTEFVGFGAASGGSNVVVQLMTEEKRGEIGLEELWTGVLNRSAKQEATTMEAEGSGETPVPNQTTDTESDVETLRPSQPAIHHLSSPSNHILGQQLRAYHTATRRLAATARTTEDPYAALDDSTGYTPFIPGSAKSDPPLASLEFHLDTLKRMPTSQALDALGDTLLVASEHVGLEFTNSDHRPTAEDPKNRFLDSFYAAMPAFPTPEHWHLLIELLAYARELGHPDSHSPLLVAQLANMQIAGLLPLERSFKLVVRSILTPIGAKTFSKSGGVMHNEAKLNVVMSILEDMEACGYDPVSPELLQILQSACLGPSESSSTLEFSSLLPLLRLARLHRHVKDDDWLAFWRTWRSYPQRFWPRTPEMYTVLFEAVGDGRLKGVEEARNVLQMCLSEMEMEEPAIVVHRHPRLAQALKKALLFVQPELEMANGQVQESKEWRGWYERCRNTTNESY